MVKNKIRFVFNLVKESGHEFIEDNVLRLCSSLAYYTVFAMGPLLLVIISVTGLFFEKQAITSEIVNQLSTFLGPDNARQVIGIIDNLRQQNTATKYSIIGTIILIVSATGVFVEIQDSINYIWSIKAKPKRGWLKYLKNRLLSFSLVIGIGFLLIVSLLVTTLTDAFTNRLQQMFEEVTVTGFKAFNLALLFVVTTSLFAIIYKILPDATIKWKDAFVGASFTGFLFLLGKFLISYYITTSSIDVTYGTAAAFIVALSWVYYSAMILYFGAEFTKVYALAKGRRIMPYRNAVFIVKSEVRETHVLPKEMKDVALIVNEEKAE
jgi:membrane protein